MLRASVWRWRARRDGTGPRSKVVIEESPKPCVHMIDDKEIHCSSELHTLLGCGFVGLEGKGHPRKYGSQRSPYNRTCPQYYARLPSVLSAYEYFSDFKAGTLGNVDDLPLRLLSALHIIDEEVNEQQRVNEERVNGS